MGDHAERLIAMSSEYNAHEQNNNPARNDADRRLILHACRW
ncbi:MAG: hypothetical protein ACLFQT_05460 [Thiohalophilus sp.]